MGLRPRQHPLKPVPQGAGFTLIELLVVILLIGIILSFAVLSVGGGIEDELKREGRRIAALVDLAGEEAVLRSRETGIQFVPDGYRFLIQSPESETGWTVLEQDSLLRARTVTPGIVLTLYLEDIPVVLEPEPEQVEPHVVLFSSGERIPFELRLGTGEDDPPYFTLSAPLIGPLELTQVSGNERP